MSCFGYKKHPPTGRAMVWGCIAGLPIGGLRRESCFVAIAGDQWHSVVVFPVPSQHRPTELPAVENIPLCFSPSRSLYNDKDGSFVYSVDTRNRFQLPVATLRCCKQSGIGYPDEESVAQHAKFIAEDGSQFIIFIGERRFHAFFELNLL